MKNPNLKKLDDAFRLTPWSDVTHADFIAGNYGSLLENPERAEQYVDGYEKAEKRFDEAYEEQRKLLSEASKRSGESGQTLPDIEKIDWDPRKRFAKAVKATKEKAEPSEPKKVEKEVKPKKIRVKRS